MPDTVHLAAWTYRRAWPAQLRHVKDARDFVDGRLHLDDLHGLRSVAGLVVSELATNAVLHARSAFTVTLSRLDRTLTLAVDDHASTRLPNSPRRWLPMTEPGGWGLYVVESVSADWGVTVAAGTKSVWAVLDLDRPT